jgi:RNA polymerase sigma-70 factor, ECF subfamily
MGVRRAQLERDAEMAGVLYAEHAPALLSYVSHLLGGDRYAAEDVVQETMLRAWRHIGELDVQTARPWLFTTARRLVIDLYRTRQVRPTEVTATDAGPLISPDGIDQALDAVLVADALTSLSPAHRQVLIDCYYRGRTVSQEAAAAGLPPGTVRSRIYYALRALRLALEERGVSE